MVGLEQIIRAVGYAGVAGAVFAESGLLIGFLLPGDSLLVTSGLLASQGYFDIRLLVPLVFVSALVGDAVGYAFGHRIGPALFKREDSLFFSKHHISRAQRFYERHGGKAVIIARFMPIVRSIAPILAGVGRMPYRRFAMFNFVGALLWAVGLSMLGYVLGETVPHIDQYILPLVAGIIILSVSPSIIHVLRSRDDRQHLVAGIKRAIWWRS